MAERHGTEYECKFDISVCRGFVLSPGNLHPAVLCLHYGGTGELAPVAPYYVRGPTRGARSSHLSWRAVWRMRAGARIESTANQKKDVMLCWRTIERRGHFPDLYTMSGRHFAGLYCRSYQLSNQPNLNENTRNLDILRCGSDQPHTRTASGRHSVLALRPDQECESGPARPLAGASGGCS